MSILFEVLRSLFKKGDSYPAPAPDSSPAKVSARSLLDLLPEVDGIHIVDVGAASHGKGTEPYASLIQNGVGRIIGFEPDRIECAKANETYKDNGHRYFPYFIGDGLPATFYETNWSKTGSLYRPNKEVLGAFEQLEEFMRLQSTHAVDTKRLDDIPEITDVDLIKIDVQGSELKVFKGADRALGQALAIHTEVEFVELYENQPLFADVDQYLRSKGFMFHCFLAVFSRSFKPVTNKQRYTDGVRQHLWSDVLYVRDFRHFDNLSSDKLKRLAVLLHDVYASYDLCLKVLQAIDKKQQTALALAYRDFLPDKYGVIFEPAEK
jgi:protein O-GlcNAc transferase